MDLNNVTWGEFIFDSIFSIHSTNSGIDKNKLNNISGITPYVTRSDKNNGVDFFVGTQIRKYTQNNSNVITIGLDTQTIFYQPHSFYTGQNIQILSNESLNYYNAMFLIPLIKKQMEKFNWGGNGATLTRLKRSRILLPINSQGQPDYCFMKSYIKQKERGFLEKYRKNITLILEIININSEIKWQEFFIGDLFTIKIGKNIDGNKIDKKSGKTAYITRKESNNGLDGFIDFDNSFLNKNFPVITIGNETAEPFVQTFSFFTGTKVNILTPKTVLNASVLFFIATSLKAHKSKYSYSFTINSTRLKRQKILLPVNDEGKPDYLYMENYIKRLEYEKLKLYLDYKNLSIIDEQK